MNNKVLVKLIIPETSQDFDMYLPINKKIGSIISLIKQAVDEFDGENIPIKYLYNADTGECYDYDVLLANTTIRNGSKIVITR